MIEIKFKMEKKTKQRKYLFSGRSPLPQKENIFLNKIKNNNNKTTGNMVWQIFTTEKYTWNLRSIFPVSELLQQEVVQVIYIASTL